MPRKLSIALGVILMLSSTFAATDAFARGGGHGGHAGGGHGGHFGGGRGHGGRGYGGRGYGRGGYGGYGGDYGPGYGFGGCVPVPVPIVGCW